MDITYINHRSYIAQNRWERRSFTHRWWRLYEGDPYWVPPYYPTLHQTLLAARQCDWQSLSIDPLPDPSFGGKFLEHQGAQARQTYRLYQAEL